MTFRLHRPDFYNYIDYKNLLDLGNNETCNQLNLFCEKSFIFAFSVLVLNGFILIIIFVETNLKKVADNVGISSVVLDLLLYTLFLQVYVAILYTKLSHFTLYYKLFNC